MFKETWQGLFRCLTTDYFTVNGRLRRRDYFMIYVAYSLLIQIVAGLAESLAFSETSLLATLCMGGVGFLYLTGAWLTATMRRLNDTGSSRCWLILPVVSLAALSGTAYGPSEIFWGCALIFLVSSGFFLMLVTSKGEAGKNAYGDNPKPPFVSRPTMMSEYQFTFKETFFDRYAQFDGRARREEYWMFTLYTVAILFALTIITSFMGGLGAIIYGVGSAVISIPALALMSRRLHDTGRSFWWYLILLVPLVGGVVLLAFTLQGGDRGPNAYGEDQKALTPEQAKFL